MYFHFTLCYTLINTIIINPFVNPRVRLHLIINIFVLEAFNIFEFVLFLNSKSSTCILSLKIPNVNYVIVNTFNMQNVTLTKLK